MIWKMSWLLIACLRSNRLWVMQYHFFRLMNFLIKTFKLNVKQDSLVFLEYDPFSWFPSTPGARQERGKKKLYRVIAPVAEDGGYNTATIHRIEKTLPPFFLIELSESLKENDKTMVKKKLAEAQAALSVLSEHLS